MTSSKKKHFSVSKKKKNTFRQSKYNFSGKLLQIRQHCACALPNSCKLEFSHVRIHRSAESPNPGWSIWSILGGILKSVFFLESTSQRKSFFFELVIYRMTTSKKEILFRWLTFVKKKYFSIFQPKVKNRPPSDLGFRDSDGCARARNTVCTRRQGPIRHSGVFGAINFEKRPKR